MLQTPRVLVWLGCLALLPAMIPYSAMGAAPGETVLRNEAGEAVSPATARPDTQRVRAAKALPRRSVSSKDIGVDAIHGNASGVAPGDLVHAEYFTQFRNEITSQGLNIVPLTSFEKADLAGLRAVIVRQHPDSTSTDDFKASEIQAIHEFVAAGGGLLACAEGGYDSDFWTPTMNLLLAPYGIALSNSPTDGSGYTIQGFVDHPLTRGLSRFGVDYQRCLTQIKPPALDLTTGSGSDDALGCVDAQGGSGNVMVVSDLSCFSDHREAAGLDRDISFGDNAPMLRNIFRYITGTLDTKTPVALSEFSAN